MSAKSVESKPKNRTYKNIVLVTEKHLKYYTSGDEKKII